eukprot:768759-Hanusia_phi.AAC.2
MIEADLVRKVSTCSTSCHMMPLTVMSRDRMRSAGPINDWHWDGACGLVADHRKGTRSHIILSERGSRCCRSILVAQLRLQAKYSVERNCFEIWTGQGICETSHVTDIVDINYVTR